MVCFLSAQVVRHVHDSDDKRYAEALVTLLVSLTFPHTNTLIYS